MGVEPSGGKSSGGDAEVHKTGKKKLSKRVL